MRIIRHTKYCPVHCQNSVVALGNFDGVHQGHQAIFQKVQQLAKQDIIAAALSFEPHPRRYFQPSIAPFRITPFRTKMQLLKHYGIEAAFVLPFTKQLAQMPAEQFVKTILVDHLRVRHVVVGYDFIFGKDRQGNIKLLQEMGRKYGFAVTQLEAFLHGEIPYSSSAIRAVLREGDVQKAADLLGHDWSVSGRVVHGDGRGASIGFPTANIKLKQGIRPAYGVYGCEIEVNGTCYKAVANFGKRPTVDGKNEWLEVHVLSAPDHFDVYGKRVDVTFKQFIRKEQKFESVEALIHQIQKDISSAKIVSTSS